MVIHSRGSGVMGFNLEGAFSPKFSAPLAVSDAKKFSKCKNGMDFLYHHAKFDERQTLATAGRRKSLKLTAKCS